MKTVHVHDVSGWARRRSLAWHTIKVQTGKHWMNFFFLQIKSKSNFFVYAQLNSQRQWTSKQESERWRLISINFDLHFRISNPFGLKKLLVSGGLLLAHVCVCCVFEQRLQPLASAKLINKSQREKKLPILIDPPESILREMNAKQQLVYFAIYRIEWVKKNSIQLLIFHAALCSIENIIQRIKLCENWFIRAWTKQKQNSIWKRTCGRLKKYN